MADAGSRSHRHRCRHDRVQFFLPANGFCLDGIRRRPEPRTGRRRYARDRLPRHPSARSGENERRTSAIWKNRPSRRSVAGAKGIAAINTVKAITNLDPEYMTAMPVVNGKSALILRLRSGPAVKPIALRFITQMKQHPELKRRLPVSGIGGIVTWARQPWNYLLVGSSTIQVTTAVMEYRYRTSSRRWPAGLSHFYGPAGRSTGSLRTVGRRPRPEYRPAYRPTTSTAASKTIRRKSIRCARLVATLPFPLRRRTSRYRLGRSGMYARPGQKRYTANARHLTLNALVLSPTASCRGTPNSEPGPHPHPVTCKLHYR